MKKKYNHPEAYCLMYYRCQHCNAIEQLWNSRDGVTPFIISCKKCDGKMWHIFLTVDSYNPDYKPLPEQRVFVDSTKDTQEESVNMDQFELKLPMIVTGEEYYKMLNSERTK